MGARSALVVLLALAGACAAAAARAGPLATGEQDLLEDSRKGKDCYNLRTEAKCFKNPDCLWCHNKWSPEKGSDGVCASEANKSELPPWGYTCYKRGGSGGGADEPGDGGDGGSGGKGPGGGSDHGGGEWPSAGGGKHGGGDWPSGGGGWGPPAA